MHAGRLHLELGQFRESLFRQEIALKAQCLAELHGRSAKGEHVVAHSLRGLDVRRLELAGLPFLAEESALREVAEVTAGDAGAHGGHAERTAGRAVAGAHAIFPARMIATPSFRERSRKASVFCLPADSSCSQ